MKLRLFWLLLLSSSAVWASPREEMTDRLIVRMMPKAQIAAVNRQAQVQQALHAGVAAGVALSHWRRMGLEAEVLKLPRAIPVSAARKLAAQISQQAGVEWAVASQRRYPAAVPNDPEFTTVYNVGDPLVDQSTVDSFGLIKHLWYLYDVQTTGDLKTLAMSINWLSAWNRSAGFSDQNYASTVAIVDTGIVSHGDLDSAHVLPGYDFIHDSPTARDNNGRDNNPTDEGDWNTTSECDTSDSSWHGTFVAGIVGATANNGTGIAGVNPEARLLPIRVLGKCGGWDEDIIDGALWAGGLSINNLTYGAVPANPNPAKVVNFSLGGEGSCDASYQTMVSRLRAAGVVVVAAAGNSRVNVSSFAPANCPGVIAVASNARSGALADYSNFGAGVSITAPGGGTTFKVSSISNAGKTTAGADSLAQERGTSFSTPMVSAGVSLIRAVNPGLIPDEVNNVLQLAATPFPANVDCDVRICGAGVLNIDNAINLAVSHVVSNTALLQFSAPATTKNITLTNKGGSAVSLGAPQLQSLSGAAGDYQLQNACGATLDPAASCTISVTFNPAATVGGRYAWLEVPAAAGTARIALFGVAGGTVLSVSPTSLSFSGQAGETTASQAAVFTNVSQQPVSFAMQPSLPGAYKIDSMDCDGQTVTMLSDCRLLPNGKLTLNVAFAPVAAGSVPVTLSVDPLEGNVAQLALNGDATASASSGGGGGCTIKQGQRDLAWLLIAVCLVWYRRRT